MCCARPAVLMVTGSSSRRWLHASARESSDICGLYLRGRIDVSLFQLANGRNGQCAGAPEKAKLATRAEPRAASVSPR